MGREIQTNGLRFMRRDLHLIELPLVDNEIESLTLRIFELFKWVFCSFSNNYFIIKVLLLYFKHLLFDFKKICRFNCRFVL
jgi:hypothetical protein